MQRCLAARPALRFLQPCFLILVLCAASCGDDKPKRAGGGGGSSAANNKPSGDGTKGTTKGPNVEEIINGSQILVLEDVVYKSGSTDPLTGTVVWMHANGKRAEEVQCLSGRWHGPAKWWYEDGTKAGEGTYADGEWDGEYKEWYPNGKVKIQLTFKEGLEQNKEVWYFESGQVMSVTAYVDGNKTGEAMGYFENGLLSWKAQWANNVPVGEYWEAYETGEKRSVRRYNAQGKEHGLEEHWFQRRGNENQVQSREVSWENGQFHGVSKEWYPNGQPMRWVTFERGAQNGSAGSYHENGQKASEGVFVNGTPSNVRRWDNAGQPIASVPVALPRARTHRWDSAQLSQFYKGKAEGDIQSDFGDPDATAAGGAWVYRDINFITQNQQAYKGTVQFTFQAGKVATAVVTPN